MSIAVVSSVISQPNTANCGVAVLSAHNLVGLFTSNTAQLLPSPSRGAVHTYNPPLPIAMAHTNRTFTSNLHRPSMAHSQAQSGPSPALLARVQEKRVELENLKELRDLSAGLASQMRALEEKLATLADGTEGIQSSCYDHRSVADDAECSLQSSRCIGAVKLAQRSTSHTSGVQCVLLLRSASGHVVFFRDAC